MVGQRELCFQENPKSESESETVRELKNLKDLCNRSTSGTERVEEGRDTWGGREMRANNAA